MQSLLNLKKAQDNKRCLLRKMFDVIEIPIRSLENLGYKASRYGPFLVPFITSKLSQKLNILIRKQFGSSERWEFEQV